MLGVFLPCARGLGAINAYLVYAGPVTLGWELRIRAGPVIGQFCQTMPGYLNYGHRRKLNKIK